MRVLHAIERFFRFWYHFVIGDDWTVAVTGSSLGRWAAKQSTPRSPRRGS